MDKPALTRALGGRMLYFETKDHRACLALPMDDRHVYVGTTDVRVDDPDARRYTDAEIDYIFDVLGPVLPGETFRREEIVFAMAGIRPLPFQKTDVPGQISRDHRMDYHAPAPGRPFETLVLVGGKWTTYRAFAEQVTDRVLQGMKLRRRTGTDRLAIGGARDLPRPGAERDRWVAALARDTGVPETRCAVLVSRYGSAARAVAEAEARDPRRFDNFGDYTPAEIVHICRTERVTRLLDVLLRRTLMGFEGFLTGRRVDAIAAVMAAELGWSETRRQEEIDAARRHLAEEHLVDLERMAPA